MNNKVQKLKDLYLRYLLLGFEYVSYEFINYKVTSDNKIQLYSLNNQYIKDSNINELIIPDWIDEVKAGFVFNLDSFNGQIKKFDFGPLHKNCNVYATKGLKTLIFNGDIIKGSTLLCMRDLEELKFTKPVILGECSCCLLDSLKVCNFENIIGYNGLAFYQCNDNITKLWENRKKEINELK